MKKIMFSDKFGLTEAVLSGRKTQTRRICKEQHWSFSDLVNANENDSFLFEQPKHLIGEVVAVAQSYESIYNENGLETMDMLVSGLKNHKGWRNKLFVRVDLMSHQIRITDVRVERLQDITYEDCLAEGVYILDEDPMNPQAYIYAFPNSPEAYYHPREAYAALIDKISGKGTWESNPYVFVYEFELTK